MRRRKTPGAPHEETTAKSSAAKSHGEQTMMGNDQTRDKRPSPSPETLSRLASNQPYKEEDISAVAQHLLTKYDYDFNKQFQVIDGLDQLSQCLEKHKRTDFEASPVFIIYRNSGRHWVTFFFLTIAQKTIMFYKDSLGGAVPDKVKDSITGVLSRSIDYRAHLNQEQTVSSHGGPMALRNLDIILQLTKKARKALVTNFENLIFCSQEEVEGIKTGFINYLLENYVLGTITDNILILAQDSEFKKALRGFVDSCLKYVYASDGVANYREIIRQELEKKENNPKYKINKKAIEDAKEEFLCNSQITELTQNNRNAPNGEESSNALKMDIAEQFPEQMKKLREIFDLLVKIEQGEKFSKTLQLISGKLDLTFEKVEHFFKVSNQLKDAKKTDIKIKTEKKCLPQVVEEIPKDFKSNYVVDNNAKTLEQLLAEVHFGDFNPDDTWEMTKEQERKYFRSKYEKNASILKLEENYYKIKKYKQWKTKGVKDILNWARSKKRKLAKEEFYEAIAVMDRANELVTRGHVLRDSQIVAILVFFESETHKGKLCQIQTGEGKTTIVSLLAALKVLQGQQVDVITSNQVLAYEGVKLRKNFYGVLGISVAHNNADEAYARGGRLCYTADVVYGSMGNFQFDFLKDTFEGLETRGRRQFGTVVLDEVDSLLIDNGGFIAKLAGPFPGIDSLKYVYIKIWQELYKAERDVMIKFEELIKEKDTKLREDTNLSAEQQHFQYEAYVSELFQSLYERIMIQIKSSDPTNLGLIPKHLKSYAIDMVEKWIDNAIYAKYQCKENEQYIIRQKDGEDAIVPVDYENTGVTMKNTIWSNGLHQFLQLKHNLHLTAESLTSSFISNIGYIKYYNNQIFGLTGTLGSHAEQELLSKVYYLDYAKIPTYKQKRFKEMSGVIVEDDHWSNIVIMMTLTVALKGRSVLIICKTINDLQNLESNFEAFKKLEKLEKLKIKTYADEGSSKIVDTTVNVGEVIIATNIAGRGTDLKTSDELERNGGLHVCVGFLPVNQRVEDQAFGRTARQGNFGTGQVVIRRKEVEDLGLKIEAGLTINEIKKKRDELEKSRLRQVETNDWPEIEFQDGIFKKFSDLHRDFRKIQLVESGGYWLAKDLKEYWAFWLRKKKIKTGQNATIESIEEGFNCFKQDARAILGGSKGNHFLGGQISHNPYYSLMQTEHFLHNHQLKKAEAALNHTINLSQGNDELMHAIYIKKFEIALEKGAPIFERFEKALGKIFMINIQKDESYKENAKDALEKAKKALEHEVNYIRKHFLGEDSANQKDMRSNADFENILTAQGENSLLKHIVSRLVILNFFLDHVSSLQEQIEKNIKEQHTAGLAIGSRSSTYLKELNPEKENEKSLKEAITDSELAELGLVGLETVYALREVHVVPPKVINRAQIQIVAGLSALGLGVAFPPSAPAMSSIAGTLISEGICDIVIELMSQGNAKFDETVYLRNKCISYGVALATMGISAIINSTTLLDKAIKACRKLSSMLRRCTVLTSVCEKLAANIDKLAIYFEKAKYISQFNKLSKLAQLEYLEKLKFSDELLQLKRLGLIDQFVHLTSLKGLTPTRMQIFMSGVKNVGKQTLQSVTGCVIGEKIVTNGLEKILSELKPEINKKVEKVIAEQLKEEELETLKIEDVPALVTKVMTATQGEMACDVLKEIVFGVLKNCKHWAMKIALASVETTIIINSIATFTNEFCTKFRKELRSNKGIQKNQKKSKVVEIIDLISAQVTEKIFAYLMQLASKLSHTFVVNPIMNKVFNSSGGEEKEEFTEEEMEQIKSFDEALDAYAALGLTPGSSKEDIVNAFDSLTSDPGISEQKSREVREAFLSLCDLHRNSDYSLEQIKPLDEFCAAALSRRVHKGNILTLCKKTEQHIIIRKCKENGETEVLEFGQKYKGDGKDSIDLTYYEPNEFHNGHYVVTGSSSPIQLTGQNNCFYDAVAAAINEKGGKTTAESLRETAQRFSIPNLFYGILTQLSRLLNNPLTAKLFMKSESALLIGGDKNFDERLEYTPPWRRCQIRNDASLKKVVAELWPFLNEAAEKADEFKMSDLMLGDEMSSKRNAYPTFTAIDGKRTMMIGVLEVVFTNGQKMKLVTVSGDVPFCVYKKAEFPTGDRTTLSTDNISRKPFTHSFGGNKEIFFVDEGTPAGKPIYDVYRRTQANHTYTKSCAGQKLFYSLGEFMKNSNQKLIVKDLAMVEVPYKAGKNIQYQNGAPLMNTVPPCNICKPVLRTATGEE